jgi:pimeloyl-ACP methyl ester carboxylesterase
MKTPALVLIHGYPFDHTMWDHVVNLLDPGIPVLAPDLRGFDGNPPGSQEPSLNVMANDLAELLEQKEITRAVVAGMSMGGYVALALAEIAKARLAGLALVDSQSIADTDEIRQNRRNTIQKIREQGPELAAKTALPKLFAPNNAERPEFVRFPLMGAQRAGIEGLSWALEAMARRPDRTELLQSLKIPILVLHGKQDQFIPAERAVQLAQSIPGTAYVELPDAGHCSPLEDPKGVADALTQFHKRCAA